MADDAEILPPGHVNEGEFTLEDVQSLWFAEGSGAVAPQSLAGSDPRLTIKEEAAVAAPDAGATLSAGIVKEQTSTRTAYTITLAGASVTLRESNVVSGEGEGPADASLDYEMDREVGRGGMGTVYVARQTSLDRRVAVKMIRAGRDRDQASRGKFIGEALTTGAVEHPNVVPIYELGVDAQNRLFYAMKEVKGRTWRQARAGLSEKENIAVLVQVANPVASAHAKGIVHRDLKPENVMLGDFGEVLVMDWGLAVGIGPRAKAEPLARDNALAGTPAYMAPEMARGDPRRIGPWSDQYLLGAILFEILTGLPPHEGDSALVCLHNAANNLIRPVDRDDEWMHVALRALDTDPVKRYPSVKHFLAAIRECQSHGESMELARLGHESGERAGRGGEYDDFSRSLLAYEQALELWGGNDAARQGRDAIRLAYADRAFGGGDYDLALSLLAKAEGAGAGDLAAKVARAKTERESRRKWVRLLAVAAVVLLVVAAVVAGGAAVLVSRQARAERVAREEAEQERAEAERQRERAEAALVEAEAQRNRAEAALIEVEAQRKRAEDALVETESQRRVAEEQRELADARRVEADNQRKRAEGALVEAESQRKRAEDALVETERQRRVAEEQRELADARRVEADGQRERAEAALVEAEVQRKRAEEALVETERQRRVTEEQRELADARRVEADSQRERAEAALVEAEAQRKRAEAALIEAESQRKRAEDALVETERQRKVAEEQRELADARRVEADSQRERAEAALVEAESQRKRAEEALIEAERQRKAAEEQRELADARRVEADSQRKRAEDALVDAESQRKRAEEALVETERQRKVAEEQRELADARRVEADSQRERAEAALVEAESQRKRAENALAEAENQRKVAEEQRELAVARQAEAEQQRRRAEEALSEAERQRGIAEERRLVAEQALADAEAARRAETAAHAATVREQELKLQAEARARQSAEDALSAQLVVQRMGYLEDNSRWRMSPDEARASRAAAAALAGLEGAKRVPLAGGADLNLALIPPGMFIMGSPPREPLRSGEEHLHQVELTAPYYIGVTELTRGQWQALVGVEKPDSLDIFAPQADAVFWRFVNVDPEAAALPATGVSSRDIEALLLPAVNRFAPEGYEFRLPTEAEWEWAARAGAVTSFASGEDADAADRDTWYEKNSDGHPRAVGGKAENAWGLLDMSGNAAELLLDSHDPLFYLTSPLRNPLCRNDSPMRVVRGGGYTSTLRQCRLASRSYSHNENRHPQVGLRLALVKKGGAFNQD